MISALQRWASSSGYRVAFGDPCVLEHARSDIDERRRSGELDPTFARDHIASFRYDQPGSRTIILVAVRRPAHRLVFELATGPFETILPPTYVRYRPFFEDVRQEMEEAIPDLKGHVRTLAAPLKAIACRLGLTMYGRNNVTYISGWGSYFQLVGYETDLDLGLPADWRPAPPRLMLDCDGCSLCFSVCPAGAIPDDRVLLHAERCTTLYSEKAGLLEHELSGRCLFGCLDCQEICPVNRDLLRVESAGISFTREETEILLRGDATTDSIERKLEHLGLTERPLIGRNLRHLIAASGIGGTA